MTTPPNPPSSSLQCRICGQEMTPHLEAKILGHLPIRYGACESCHSVASEAPHWLEEAYQEEISSMDTGMVQRNLRMRNQILPIVHEYVPQGETAVDVSGGYGLFTRLMRDKGFHFLTTDPYCKNILAPGFDVQPTTKARFLTLFEVMEHLTHPVDFLKETLDRYESDILLFSTEVFEGSFPREDWWYYCFETGQHVQFYSRETLEKIASTLGFHYTPYSNSLHIFHRSPLKKQVKAYVSYPEKREKIFNNVRMQRKGRSLTQQDSREMAAKFNPAKIG